MRRSVRLLVALGLGLAAGVVAAQPAPPFTRDNPDLLAIDADAPVMVWINGLEVALAPSTGTVDHVTLNDDAVQRIGLSAAPPDNTADLIIGGRKMLQGRHGRGWLGTAGERFVGREYYWFPGVSRLPLAGTIGPFALPHWRVRVNWSVPFAGPVRQVLQLPLMGGIDRAAYGILQTGRRMMAVGVDVRTRRPLPLVTAATAADLAADLGGRFVGEPWQMEILMGVRRPVRRLELDRPLMIGPIRITALAVRTGGPRDGTMTLERGQQIPLDAEEDPDTVQIRGRTLRQRAAARYIMLSRTQLEAHGCSSLLVDKAANSYELTCAPPARPVTLAAARDDAVPVPVGPVPLALMTSLLPPADEIRLAVTEPLRLGINGRPLRLMLGDAGASGLMLNAESAMAVSSRDAERLRDQMAERARALIDLLGSEAVRPLDAVRGPGQAGVPIMPPDAALPAEVTLELASRAVQVEAQWRSGPERLPHDGRIALAALPAQRLRLALGPAAQGPRATMQLPLSDRSHDQSLQGVASLPGIPALFVALDIGRRRALPVVSLALGEDLVRLHGGRETGQSWWETAADGRRRRHRRLDLATPLIIGGFRFDAVAVAQSSLTAAFMRSRPWPKDQPWPDAANVAGLEREIRLSDVQLAAAGCDELVVDKPSRRWALSCAAAPLPAPPAPSDQPAGPALPAA